MSGNLSEAQQFIEAHSQRVQPLFRESNLASWEAATTGSEEAIQRSAEIRTRVKQIYSEKESFESVRRLRAGGPTGDALIDRQLLLLEHAYTENQLPPEMIEELTFRESELERIFYNFRATVDGKELSNNGLRDLLQGELNNARRREVWEASKAIGARIAPLLLDLVRRRNQAARDLGFTNYYSMELELQEIDEDELFALLADFSDRSDEAFRELKGRLDAELAARYGVSENEVRPWHWDDFFSQEAPAFGEVDLDPIFAPLDHEAVARDYFAEIGLPVEDVLERSDLHERDGKDQHAFCTDIDREGDVRMLCNLRPNERWMGTLLHELGHAVYDKYIPRTIPYLLRTAAHTLSTESIAMYFGRLTRDPEWLRQTIGTTLDPEQEAAVHEQQRLSMLVAMRWMLVMVHFEQAMYANPDREDLNSLWWDFVEKYQLIRRPEGRNEPDWATKLHLSLAPVYYHNYLLGELMASQLTHAMRELPGGSADAGFFLQEQIFSRGATLPWNELLREATGEPLSAGHFVDQFVGEPLAGGA